jgi:nucleolar protein 56
MADAKTLFTLLECAAGYALFEVVAFEEIGNLLEGAMDTVTDIERFGRAVKLKAFSPFESAHDALENANAISEHSMTGSLHDFLEMNLPKVSKKSGKTPNFSLGVIDPALATSIQEGLSGVACRSDDTVREVLRGCRMHLSSFFQWSFSRTGCVFGFLGLVTMRGSRAGIVSTSHLSVGRYAEQ